MAGFRRIRYETNHLFRAYAVELCEGAVAFKL